MYWAPFVAEGDKGQIALIGINAGPDSFFQETVGNASLQKNNDLRSQRCVVIWKELSHSPATMRQ